MCMMLWRIALGNPAFRLLSPKKLIVQLIAKKPFVKICQTPKVALRLESFGSTIVKIGGLSTSLCGLKLLFTERANCEGPVDPGKEGNAPTFDWSKFLGLLYLDLWALITAIFAALFVAYLNVQIPIHLGKVVNVMSDIIKTSNFGALLGQMKDASFKLVQLYLSQAIATLLYISLLSQVGERMAKRLRYSLFESIIHQDMEFFDQKRTGELIDCLTTDVQEFKSAFKQCISQGLRSITQISGCVISLYVISPVMTTTMLIVIPSVIVVGTMIGSLLRGLSRKVQEQAIIVTSLAEEVISNIRTVRAFANETKECDNFENEMEKLTNLNIKLGIGIGIFQAGSNLFLNGLVLGTLYLGGRLMMTDNLSPGNLMSFLVAIQTIQRSLSQLSLLLGHFVKGKQAGARVFEYIDKKPKMQLTGREKLDFNMSRDSSAVTPGVVFENVTFAYPSRPKQIILQNLNLILPPGKTVAIVGSSGNGKSTIAALLERLYDISEGSIKIGENDIRSLHPNWLRGSVIGIINQEPILFATSIKENIRYGKPNATDEEVFAAAQLSNAHEFIQSFPDGYETILGERGVTVSGGQKQRIAIARALIKNPLILILDEATSALDPESEKVVQKTLERVCKDRTVLVIAHRLSTVKDADLIVVLRKGVIVEKGNHKSLYAQKGVYYNLMNQQELDSEEQFR